MTAASQTQPLPEFLCLKYKGVRRIDQILAQAESFGWKCRKYQNWKQVHVENADKLLLKSVGDLLIDEGKFDLKAFGRLSKIFLNVQRWRADREQMAVDPELLVGWSDLDRLLHVIKERPVILTQKLRRDFTGYEGLSKDSALTLFFATLLLKMLNDEGVPLAAKLSLEPSMPAQERDEVVRRLIQNLYSAVGLPSPPVKPTAGGILPLVFANLGFSQPSFDPASYKWDLTEPTPTAVTLRYIQLSPSVLMKVEISEGATVLVLNSQHPFLADILKNPSAKAAVEQLLSAYAEAMQQMPSSNEDLVLFTSLVGMILRRR